MEVIWSRLARMTLADVASFVENRFNRNVAQKVTDEIIRYTELLGFFPRSGHKDEELVTDGFEARMLVCKKSVVYYVIRDNVVIIAAVFDTRRNPANMRRQILNFLDDLDKTL